MKNVGYTWLIPHFKLETRPLLHSSFIGTKPFARERANGAVEEHYTSQYYPGDEPLDHLEFALKYDGLDLDILRKVFLSLSAETVAEFVSRTPTGINARRIGFWYETLTGQKLPLKIQPAGNYAPLLDPEQYVVSESPANDRRWRLRNNAGGDARFIPIIRKTPAIRRILETDWKRLIEEALKPFSPELLHRALSQLYFKETRSSFAIEREEPGSSRTTKFVTLLHKAGTLESPLSEETLTGFQNAIMDERYQERGYRTIQNYVGETSADFRDIVHLVGAPPEYLQDLMAGLEEYFRQSEGIHPVLRAASISFPFVFIHPFLDGNGRIHRYLIHDTLARGGIGGDGLILPISAEILADMKGYDTCLERFSKPLLSIADYDLNSKREMTVSNPAGIEGLYRYPDVTAQAEHLAGVIELSITNSLVEGMRFLERLSHARQAIRGIVDMPDRKLDSLLMRLQRNQGSLAKKRREGEFKELTDQEVAEIEEAFQSAFAE